MALLNSMGGGAAVRVDSQERSGGDRRDAGGPRAAAGGTPAPIGSAEEAPIAYLIHSFPQFSTTFVSDEIDEMRRQGARIRIFGIQPPARDSYPSAFQRFRDEAEYVFPIRPFELAARHLQAFAGRPIRYLRTLIEAATWGRLGFKDRIRTLVHFVEAVHLYPMLRAAGCGHLHVHFLIGGASIGLFLHRLYGLTYSITAHGSDIFVERVLQREKIEHATFTRVATRYNLDFLRGIFGPEESPRLKIRPFGLELAKFGLASAGVPHPAGRAATAPERRPSEGSRGGADPTGEAGDPTAAQPVRLLNVGRLVWQKAQDLLLDACAVLDREGRDFHLAIVGDGELRAPLQDKIRSLGLERRVALAGAMPETEVIAQYRKADLFVLSSVSEGSPFVILEAMACGLPVVAPRLHGIPEMVGEDGVLFDKGDAESLADALRALIDDAPRRERLGRAGVARILEQYDNRGAVSDFRGWIDAARGRGAI